MFTALFSVLSVLLFSVVNALPVDKPTELLAVAPHVTYPTAGAILLGGTTDHVDWDTTSIPPAAQGYTVTVLLGYLANNSENLDIKHPLVTRVPIMAGTASFTVPSDLAFGTNYVAAVIGDSGDISEPFTIVPTSPSSLLSL